jgi:hypothetical protein
LVWALGRGGGGAGEQVRRRLVNAAAAAAVPGELGALGPGRRADELRLGRRKVEEALEEHAADRKGELTAAAGLGAAGGSVWAGGERTVAKGRPA